MSLLKDIVSIDKGKRYDLLDEFQEGAIRVFQANDFRNENKPQYTFDKNGLETIEDDILVVWDGSVGQMGFGKKGYVGSTIVRVRVKDKTKFSPFFIYKFLQTKAEYLKRKSTGATIQHINRKSLELLAIPSIPLNQQLQAANLLNKAETLIEQRIQSIKLLDSLWRNTFLEMFGDPNKNSKKWERKKLRDVCDKIQDGTHFSPPIVKEGIPYITAKHIRENVIDFWANPWFISNESHQEIYKRCSPVKGDVIYIKDGATTGFAAINKYDFEFSMLSSIALLKVNKNILTSEYLCSWLNNPSVKIQILKKMAGGAIKRLTLTKINELPILLPPVELQIQFSDFVVKIETLKERYKTSLKELERMYGVLSKETFEKK